MLVPEGAEPWIKQHRSSALGDVKAAYARLIREDYEEMERWLPSRCGSILDIGCGLAGIDTYLYERYDRPALNLLDGTRKAAHNSERIDFHAEGMLPYNDMMIARELLTLNGIAARDIYEWPIGHKTPSIPCNLCISLLSWGWHYPIETYVDLAWDSLAAEGKLILDVRGGHLGAHALTEKGFKFAGTIRMSGKGLRMCYTRPRNTNSGEFNSAVFK